MWKTTKYNRIISIDPAIRKKGIGCCEYTTQGNTIRFIDCYGLKELFDYLLYVCGENTLIVIENSNLSRPLFSQTGSTNTLIAKALSVGKNQGVSQAITEFCMSRFGNVKEFSPKEKGKKLNIEFISSWALGENIVVPKKITQDNLDALKMILMCL